MKKKDIIIFTDGSSRGNPGPGGFGALCIDVEHNYIVELGGSKNQTTNNEMELMAVIIALEKLTTFSNFGHSVIMLYIDSKYVIQGITDWIFGWQKNGWKTKANVSVKNMKLWKRLLVVTQKIEKTGATLVWKHVFGHVGVAGNERVDNIAFSFADGKKLKLFDGRLSEYQKKNIINVEPITTESKKRNNRFSSKGEKAYSYVSLLDGVVQRHTSWSDCELRVKGRNAKFKKTLSHEHEKEILDEWKK